MFLLLAALALQPTAAPTGWGAAAPAATKAWPTREGDVGLRKFRFRSGEFAMIGLIVDGKPLLRAYSIASPSWDDELEFYSIKVEPGNKTIILLILLDN